MQGPLPLILFAALDYPNQDERQLIWNQLENWLATLETSLSSEEIREIFNGVQGTELEPFFLDEKNEQVVISSRLDNLGKGASGAAIQCMNLVLGYDEALSL